MIIKKLFQLSISDEHFHDLFVIYASGDIRGYQLSDISKIPEIDYRNTKDCFDNYYDELCCYKKPAPMGRATSSLIRSVRDKYE